ncbi:MAG: rSAM/selenodomain-associated transferase 1 [bacterium]
MNNLNLILFTKYPKAGNVKTRLIPALGAEGACETHQEMAEYAFSLLSQYQKQQPNNHQLETHFAGGSQQEMNSWLGSNTKYTQQAEGDLGNRMSHAFQKSFQDGFQKAIIIGTDCPEITEDILEQASQQLDKTDLVLGPTTDGGYYLIGLRKHYSELFQNIPWSTEQVFDLTIQTAKQTHCSYSTLPKLNDIDRPEDLVIWNNLKETSL